MTRRRWAATALAVVAGALVAVGASRLGQPGVVAPPTSGPVLPLVTPAFPAPGAAEATSIRIVSKDLGINLPVVEGDGWTVPYNTAAHYPGMKLPGENGRSMIYAHALPGMFGSLSTAHKGQVIEIQRPGKPTLRYAIQQFFPRWPPNDLRYVQAGDHEELVLLTCTTYSANDPRIIAVAEPL